VIIWPRTTPHDCPSPCHWPPVIECLPATLGPLPQLHPEASSPGLLPQRPLISLVRKHFHIEAKLASTNLSQFWSWSHFFSPLASLVAQMVKNLPVMQDFGYSGLHLIYALILFISLVLQWGKMRVNFLKTLTYTNKS